MEEWLETIANEFKRLQSGNKSSKSCLDIALSRLSSTSSMVPLLLHHMKGCPCKGISKGLASVIAFPKPLISQIGWSTLPFLSSFDKRSLKSLMIYTKEWLCHGKKTSTIPRNISLYFNLEIRKDPWHTKQVCLDSEPLYYKVLRKFYKTTIKLIVFPKTMLNHRVYHCNQQRNNNQNLASLLFHQLFQHELKFQIEK